MDGLGMRASKEIRKAMNRLRSRWSRRNGVIPRALLDIPWIERQAAKDAKQRKKRLQPGSFFCLVLLAAAPALASGDRQHFVVSGSEAPPLKMGDYTCRVLIQRSTIEQGILTVTDLRTGLLIYREGGPGVTVTGDAPICVNGPAGDDLAVDTPPRRAG